MEIKIRDAVKSDSQLIARVIAMAIGYDLAEDYAGDDVVKVLGEAAATEDAQYSYRNALVAEVDGEPAGAIVGYDGGSLKKLREASLAVIRKYHPGLEINEDETYSGEFYLDSIGVLPQYRGLGIATMLINAMVDKEIDAGHKCFGLLVDFNNADAERLYVKLGFNYVGERPFFGHMMKHLQKRY